MDEARPRQSEIVAYFKDDGTWCAMFILSDRKLICFPPWEMDVKQKLVPSYAKLFLCGEAVNGRREVEKKKEIQNS